MTAVAWRQSRIEVLITLGILLAMAVYLVPTGLDKMTLFRDSGLEACLDAGRDCGEVRDRFTNSYNSLYNIVGWFNFVPAIVGMILAGPLVMEFERGTYRLAWTQSITRERWFLTKLLVALGGVAVFAVALTLLMTWWHSPLDRSVTLAGKDLGQSYDFEGAMPFAYTLFALAAAIAAGAWSRRVVAAMPLALVGYVVLRLSLQQLLRQGVVADAEFESPSGQLALSEATRDMGRFWAMQATEAAIFLSIAVALLATTLWLVKRRMT